MTMFRRNPSPTPTGRRARRIIAGTLVAGLLTTPLTVTHFVSAAPSQGALSFVGLTVGARGAAVAEVQAALIAAGVRVVGGADGVFGPMTAAALREFQTRHALPTSGIVDQATLVALGLAPSPQIASLLGLARTATGSSVAELQQALIAAGVPLVGGVDGMFGPATERALRQFQTQRGLTATGTVDEATARALAGAPAVVSAPATGSLVGLRIGARGDLVRAVQQALLDAGIAVPGGADGVFGPATANSLRVFQSRAGVRVTGEIDAATAALLTGQTLAAPADAPRPTALLGLTPGARGPQVAQLQSRLIAAGITFAGGADGVFGPATANALREFQGARDIEATGTVDAATAAALEGVSATPAPAPTPVPAPSPAPAPDAPNSSFPQLGDRGPQVAALQRALIAAGIAVPGGADGIFGSMTAGAVIAFQRQHDLPVNGVVDARVASLLGLDGGPAPEAAPQMPTVALEFFPVQGRCTFADTWHYPRGGGRLHIGVDIIAPEGNLIYAVASGTITRIFREGENQLTGNGLRLTMDDGTYFFYAHLRDIAPGIQVGTSVVGGQILGTNGATGNAGVPHLHFEIHPGGIAPVNPYPYVKAVDGCRTTTVPPQPRSLGQLAADAALTQLGVNYVFNTAIPGVSFDCSGLTTWAWSLAGVRLTRQSQAQFAETTQIAASEAQAGDLLFFHDPISHVGLYLGDGRMVHAPEAGTVVNIREVNWSNVRFVTRPA